jgi:hypothetical protein
MGWRVESWRARTSCSSTSDCASRFGDRSEGTTSERQTAHCCRCSIICGDDERWALVADGQVYSYVRRAVWPHLVCTPTAEGMAALGYEWIFEYLQADGALEILTRRFSEHEHLFIVLF